MAMQPPDRIDRPFLGIRGNTVQMPVLSKTAASNAGSFTSPQAILDAPARWTATIDGIEHPFNNSQEKFDALAESWNKYNGGRPVEFSHFSYLQIIGMGSAVLPILLDRLQQGEGNWLMALKAITGATVTTPEMRGDFAAIKDAWKQWGKENGIRSELRQDSQNNAG